METQQLNRVQLRGICGAVRRHQVGDKTMAQITLATNFVYRSRTGELTIETTWHTITAFEGDHIKDLDLLQKGSKVEIVGRIRTQRYTRADGTGAYSTDVLAHELTILPEDSTLTYQQ